jgi:glycosyltransferase involved in cell wall biosynthesis
MKRIRIGIHLYQETRRLNATIAALHANTNVPFELILLPDGPDEEMRVELSTLHDLPQSEAAEPRGAAASFNRLAAAGEADVIVLLESGCLVAPEWLDCLLAALDSDARNGLAGPTTNMCWNEQCVYPQGGDSSEEIARTARDAAGRFGGTTRTLEPLHSLADFCYAVRREVIETIGTADEAYGLGPCWEMDYNIRAARAGFRGVWACAAYVHRMSFTARRTLEEARRFEASKHRYQDKFCGARLQGHKSDYRFHCRGDSCPNFASPSLIAIRGPLPSAPPAAPERPAQTPSLFHPPSIPPGSPACERPANSAPCEPLVSCVMPTSNRPRFVRQAIRCFLRQDYPNTELLVLDDGTDAVGDCIPEDSRIRYVRLDRKLPLGAKRNLACAEARGDFIVHWDDDDWYPPWRVRVQVRALLDRPSEVCGSSRLLYYEATTDRTWEYRYAAGSANWLAGNTLAYRKEFWARNRFLDIQVGEDAHFVWNSRNAALADLGENRLCVGMIHAGNTSRKDTGGAFWHLQPSAQVQALLGDDVHFYRTIEPADPFGGWPLVSCIMPTYNRRALVPLALQLFCRQDYPHRELIVVDDGDDAVGDLVSNAPDVRYFRLPARTPIGAKRNFACQQAQGEIIAHWDDDDWYAPERLRYQVAPILADQADLTGLENAFVLEPGDGRFWTTRQDLHRQMFFGNVHGGTLVFRKQLFAEGVRYPELNLAEDAWLLQTALKRGKRLLRLSNPGVFVYMRHGRNAWKDCVPGRFLNPAGWERVARPPTFSVGMLSSYQAATTSTPTHRDGPS